MNNPTTTIPAGFSRGFLPLALIILSAVIITALTAVMYIFDPSITSWYPQCIFHKTTGWLCPGCGGLRATHALLHGRILDAFLLNPLLFVPMALIPVSLFRRHWLLHPRFAWSCLGVVVAYFIIRNLPL